MPAWSWPFCLQRLIGRRACTGSAGSEGEALLGAGQASLETAPAGERSGNPPAEASMLLVPMEMGDNELLIVVLVATVSLAFARLLP